VHVFPTFLGVTVRNRPCGSLSRRRLCQAIFRTFWNIAGQFSSFRRDKGGYDKATLIPYGA
jgi:hypothetical protein